LFDQNIQSWAFLQAYAFLANISLTKENVSKISSTTGTFSPPQTHLKIKEINIPTTPSERSDEASADFLKSISLVKKPNSEYSDQTKETELN